MRQRMALAALLLVAPATAWGQSGVQPEPGPATGPERMLPARTQLYFRWDGAKAHRAEFDATAWGKTLKGDTGRFFREVWTYATESIEQALNQKDPEAAGVFRDAIKALGTVTDGGIALGVELDQVNPPSANAVVVFPGAAGKEGTLLPLVQKAVEIGHADVKETKVGRRSVRRLDIDGVPGLSLGWWAEGSDAVFMIGTKDPAAYVKDIDEGKTGLARHPLYAKVRSFKEFTTGARGFLDVESVLGKVEDISPEAAKLVEALGVRGLKNITLVSGYDGIAFRDVIEADLSGPRQGLLSLASTRKFTLKDLPPLPSDATSFSAASLDVAKAYDVIVQLVESGVRIFAPDQAENIAPAIKAVEQVIGVNLRDDLFGCFGDLTVSYSSRAEGPLGLGSTSLYKVKDGAKLVRSIETLVKNIPNMGFELNLRKKEYRGVEIMDLHVKAPQVNVNVGSFAVYKDWFVFSKYPQGIKGFILRSQGELPTWKASDDLTKVLDRFPKEFTGIDVSDPRPTIEFLLSLTPPVVGLLNNLTGFVPNLRPFDLDVIPHAQEATRHLFPSVTVTTDDGKKLRSESRSSLGLP